MIELRCVRYEGGGKRTPQYRQWRVGADASDAITPAPVPGPEPVELVDWTLVSTKITLKYSNGA